MDNMSLIQKMPPMLSGSELEQALTILPEYDPGITNENAAVRLIALSDMYKVFIPTQMSKEIYAKMYLSLLRKFRFQTVAGFTTRLFWVINLKEVAA